MKRVFALTLLAVCGNAAADDRSTAGAFMECARISNDARRLACYDRLATELIELGLSSRAAAEAPVAAAPTASAPTASAPTASAPTATAPSATAPSAAAPTAASPSASTPTASAPAAAAPAATAPAASTSTAAAPPVSAPPATVAAPAPAATPQAAPTTAAPAPAPAAAATPAIAPGENEASFGYERTADGQSKALKEIRSRHVGEFTGWTGKTVFRLENGQVWQQTRSGRLVWRADSPMITIRRGFMGGYRLSVDGVNKQVYVKRLQ